jgi:DNA mismatch repair ATPase MutS
VAEVARAHEMWQAAAYEPGLFLIDEIFRGTNYTESVSAAIGLLEGLAERGLVIAATHNVELTSLLNGRFVYLLAVRDGGQPERFDLRAGVLEKTNALKILGESDFGAGMLKRIAEVKAAIGAPDARDQSRTENPDVRKIV